jgi:hypothetical protein
MIDDEFDQLQREPVSVKEWFFCGALVAFAAGLIIYLFPW